MGHGEHICEYTHVYGFLNMKRYGLTVVGDITVDGFFALFSFYGVVATILIKEVFSFFEKINKKQKKHKTPKYKSLAETGWVPGRLVD